jgi:hypothetical protein
LVSMDPDSYLYISKNIATNVNCKKKNLILIYEYKYKISIKYK